MPLKAVIVYDDVHAAQCAARLLGNLERELADDIELSIDLWRFDYLNQLSLRDEVESGTNSGVPFMLLLAASSRRRLSSLADWMDKWLATQIRGRNAGPPITVLISTEATSGCAGLPQMVCAAMEENRSWIKPETKSQSQWLESS